MAPSALLLLLVLQVGLGHEHHHEDHYVGQQHNPEHDLNILLGDKGTEEIKKLGPAEQKKSIVEIVKKIDTNGDNLLGEEELALWIKTIYRKYAVEDAAERLPQYDTNQDGVVTWEEYDAVAHGQLSRFDDSAAPQDPEQESLRQLLLKARRRFDSANVDGGAGLNDTEFLAFTHPSEVDYMSDFAVDDVLSEYDSDKDGFISMSEFVGGDEDSLTRWELEETSRFNELYDQDKDGRLDREEQLRWVASNSYGSARQEALHLISEMDSDSDGQISLAEVLKDQTTFVNSEVTDYGRELHMAHDEL